MPPAWKAVTALILLLTAVQAQGPPSPLDQSVTGTKFLDHDSLLEGFWGKTFLKANIPYIDIPDKNIEEVYYYRWSVLQRHLRYVLPGTGYMVTEFMQPVGYAGAFGSINAAAGHHIEEAQWLRSTYFAQDYTQLWTRGPGNSAQYTHWIMEAALSAANVTGELGFLEAQLQGMIRMWYQWDYTFDSRINLYYYTPNFDAQEYSLPGFAATHGVDNTLERDGPNTFRPSHNAYMVANARAIAYTAKMLGRTGTAETFTSYATKLESAIYAHLWDPKQKFFVDVVRPHNTNLNPIRGREEVGFYPFRFNIGLSSTYANPAIEQLFQAGGFLTEYGPPTLETRNHGTSNATIEEYYKLLSVYAMTQHKDGSPYVAESHYPENSSWSQDSYNHSEHYMHSTYNHNIVTGLFGIVPRADAILEVSPLVPSGWTYFVLENVPYHGHLVTLLYDEDGSRYNAGKGFSVYIDGKRVLHRPTSQRMKVQLDGNNAQQPSASSLAPKPVQVNVAVNPNGLGNWPLASATYTFNRDDPYKAIDGALFYDSEPDNRWTNYQSPHTNDTLRIQLPRPRNLTGVVLAIYDDSTRTPAGRIACPSAVEITDANGKSLASLSDFASSCLPNDRNIISFGNTIETDTVHINLHNQGNYYVGVSEVEMWIPANTGPFYYAVDAFAQRDAKVVFDEASQTTSNGAVLAVSSADSIVAFSAIYSARGGVQSLRLDYKNNGTSTPSIRLSVNQIAAGNATLAKTIGNGYGGVEIKNVLLQKGLNYVTLYGGGESVFMSGLGVM